MVHPLVCFFNLCCHMFVPLQISLKWMHMRPTSVWYIVVTIKVDAHETNNICLINYDQPKMDMYESNKIWYKHENGKCKVERCKVNLFTTLFCMDFCLFITMNGNNPANKPHMSVIIHDIRLLLTTGSYYVVRRCGRWNIHVTASLLPFYICNPLHSSQGKVGDWLLFV